MFWSFIIVLPTIFITHKVMSYYYPKETKNITMKTSWNALELCSNFEIYISNVYNKIKLYLPSVFEKKNEPIITFVKDGDEIVIYSLSEFINIQRRGKIILKYDFVLYEIPLPLYDKYDKYILRYENHNDIMHLEYQNSVNTFDLNMIQITFKNSGNTYKIDFGRNNFNMDGNILFDRNFIKWYLNMHHSYCLDDDDKYDITFIDHNMNSITLPYYCYIIIDKKNYKIINDTSFNSDENIDDLIIHHIDSSLESSLNTEDTDTEDVEDTDTEDVEDTDTEDTDTEYINPNIITQETIIN